MLALLRLDLGPMGQREYRDLKDRRNIRLLMWYIVHNIQYVYRI